MIIKLPSWFLISSPPLTGFVVAVGWDLVTNAMKRMLTATAGLREDESVCDLFWPIRGQFLGHVISIDQSEARERRGGVGCQEQIKRSKKGHKSEWDQLPCGHNNFYKCSVNCQHRWHQKYNFIQFDSWKLKCPVLWKKKLTWLDLWVIFIAGWDIL